MRIILICFIFLGLMSCAKNEGEEASLDEQEQKQLLIFSKTEGFRHNSIDVAVPALRDYAEERGVSVHTTEDENYFTDENLNAFHTVIFISTTGPIFSVEQQSAFERYIQNGGGFVGIHAATDTQEFPPPRNGEGPNEYWEWYGQLIGGYFKNHPEQQDASIIVTDSDHPATNMLEESWNRYDEWYNFWEIPDHVNVLLSLDSESFEGSGHPGNHPIAWYHEFDGGRSFYTGLGHTEESWTEDDLFLLHVWGGILYAMGEVN